MATGIGMLAKSSKWFDKVNKRQGVSLTYERAMQRVSSSTWKKVEHLAENPEALLKEINRIRAQSFTGYGIRDRIVGYLELVIHPIDAGRAWISTGPTPGLHLAIDKGTDIGKRLSFIQVGGYALEGDRE